MSLGAVYPRACIESVGPREPRRSVQEVMDLSPRVYVDIMAASYDPGYLPEPRGQTMVSRVGRIGPNDVGTLWTMRRLDYHARCALIAWPSDWELRILVEGETLLTERCPRGAEAFRLAEQWRGRMIQHGWRQITPQTIADHLHL